METLRHKSQKYLLSGLLQRQFCQPHFDTSAHMKWGKGPGSSRLKPEGSGRVPTGCGRTPKVLASAAGGIRDGKREGKKNRKVQLDTEIEMAPKVNCISSKLLSQEGRHPWPPPAAQCPQPLRGS